MFRPLVCIFWTAALLGACAEVHSAPAPGEQIAPFSLARIDGGRLGWKAGRTTVISFCAFWCDTWKEQSTRLASTQKALSGLPVEFVMISVDGRWSERCAGKLTGALLLDQGKLLSTKLGINAIPYTIVVDSAGRVRYASQGIVRSAEVSRSVRECLSTGHSETGATIYLTFDDFPSPENRPATPGPGPDARLLNILKENDIKATFFCICNRLESSRDIIGRANREGHSLQVHSWDHAGNDAQVKRCSTAIEHIAGKKPTLYRPAGSDKCFNIGGTELAMTVVNPYDYKRPGKDELKRRLLLAIKPGLVVLLHAGVSETIDVLPEVIGSLRERGFVFGVLR